VEKNTFKILTIVASINTIFNNKAGHLRSISRNILTATILTEAWSCSYYSLIVK
jgi:hypothetical protein